MARWRSIAAGAAAACALALWLAPPADRGGASRAEGWPNPIPTGGADLRLWGAKGDGTTDAAPAFAAALAWACLNSGTILIPGGQVFDFKSSVAPPPTCDDMTIAGSGTILRDPANATAPWWIDTPSHSALYRNWTIAEITIDGNWQNTPTMATALLVTAPVARLTIRDTVWRNIPGDGMQIAGEIPATYTITAQTSVGSTTLTFGATQATSGATASGQNALTFAALPTGAEVGRAVTDLTSGTAIPPGTTVTAVDTAAHTVTLSAYVAGGGVGSGDTIQFGTPPSVHPGAYVIGNSWDIDPDDYVAVTGVTTVTLANAVSDTILSGSTKQFTNAFTTSADAFTGAAVLPTASTNGLSVGETVWPSGMPLGQGCVPPKTTITAIAPDLSVTLSNPLSCKLANGSKIAAAAGVSDLSILGSRFDTIGQQNQTSGTATFIVASTASAGATSLTFNCYSGAGCSQIGLISGNLTAATGLPAGVPANDLVVNGPTSIDIPSGTFTVTLAAALTSTVTAGTAIPFQVGGLPGTSYAVQIGWGGWFANQDIVLAGNTFRHTWSSPAFIASAGNLTLEHNVCREDYAFEFRSYNFPPSACAVAQMNWNVSFKDNDFTGATNVGIEAYHNIGLSVTGGNYSYNGIAGIGVYGGRNITISGIRCRDNGQYLNNPLVQQYNMIGSEGPTACLQLDGSATAGAVAAAGTASHITAGPIDASDDQPSPTQGYAIAQINTLDTLSDYAVFGIVAGGVSNAAVYNTYLASGLLSFTPTITCGSGAVAGYTTQSGLYRIGAGKATTVSVDMLASGIGTCSGTITLSLPAVSDGGLRQALAANDNTTSATLSALVVPNTTTVKLFTATGGNPTPTDEFIVTGTYQ